MASVEIGELQKKLQEMELKLKVAEEDARVAVSEVNRLVSQEHNATQVVRPIMVNNARKLERFRDRPEKSSEMTVDEWVNEVRSHLATRHLNKQEQAAFIVEHLIGKARREINGRGETISKDPERIFTVLSKVFGDGDSLPKLQERFFSFKQLDSQDIVTVSLELVDLFDRITALDPNFLDSREKTLKGRLAQAVQDENLQREIRRLNEEAPDTSFFEVRDRAIQWLGTSTKPTSRKMKETVVQEVSTENRQLVDLVKKQSDQIAAQQDQINQILSAMKDRPKPSFQRRCYVCRSTEHMKRDCPHAEGKSQTSN